MKLKFRAAWLIFFSQNNIQYELIKADQMENTPGSIYILGRSYGRKLGKGRCG